MKPTNISNERSNQSESQSGPNESGTLIKVDVAAPINENDELAMLRELETLRVSKQYDEAEKLIDEALKRFPQSVGTLNGRGLLHCDQQHYEKAVEAFDRVLEIDPNNEFAWQWKLTSLRIGKRSEEADKLIDEALTKVPTSAGILNERGISYFNQKKYDQAVETFDKALGIDPNNEFAWQWKLTSLRIGKRSEEADKLIDEALAKFPNSVGILGERGLLEYDRQEYDQAVEAFDKALGIDPNNEFAWQWKLTSLRVGKRSEEADKLIDEALAKVPRSAVILNERGLLEYDRQEYDPAVEAFDKALEIDPNNEFAWQLKLRSLRVGKRSEEADKLIDEALAKFPNSVGILNERGISYFNQEKYDPAVEAFDKALGIDPNNEFAWPWKLTSLRVGKRSEEADKLIDEALAKVPRSAVILNERGISYFNQMKYDQAVEAFDKALEIDPNNEFAWLWKLTSLRIGKRSEEADKLIDEALTRVARSVGILNERGISYYNQKKYDQAVEAFDKALEIDPHNEFAWNWKLTVLRVDKRYEEAEKLIEEALQKVPRSAVILNECGLLHYDQKQYDKAVEAFDKALAIDPHNEFAWNWKLRSLRANKRYEEAEKLFEDALQKVPRSVLILNERGLLRYDQKQYDKAVEAFDKALEIDPHNEFAWNWKLTSLRANKRYEEAEKLIEEALQKVPRSAVILNECGMLHYDQRQYDKAVEVFDKALEIDPHNEFAWNWKLTSLRMSKRFEEAEKLIGEKLQRFPNSVPIMIERGLLHYDQMNYDKSAATFATVIEIEKDDEFAIQFRIRSLRMLAGLFMRPGYRTIEKELNSALDRLPNSGRLWIERGFLLYDRRRYGEAVKAFDKALVIDPLSEEAFLGKIDSLRASRRLEEAVTVVREGFAALPGSIPMLDEQAAVHYAQKRYERAVAAFDQVLNTNNDDVFAIQVKVISLRAMATEGRPEKLDEAEKVIDEALKGLRKNPDLLMTKAWVCFDQKRFEDAEDLMAEAILVSPDRLTTLFGQVEFFTKSNRPDRALEILQNLKETHEARPDVVEQLGLFYFSRGDYLNAEKEFKTVVDEWPAQISNSLGIVYLSLRQYEKAQEYFRAACKAEPKDPTLITNLGWALVRSGKKSAFQEAAELCGTALTLDKAYAPALGCLGVMSFKQGCLREAEEYLRESARVGRAEGNLTELGALYFQIGKNDEALETLHSAIKNNPKDLQAHIELGNLYLQTDRASDAIKEFRQAVAIGPENEDAHRAMAIALMKMEKLDEAEGIVRTAIKKLDRNKRWLLHLTLAQLLTKRGDNHQEKQYYDEALSEVKQAIELMSDRAEGYLHSGIIRYKLGDLFRALIDFRKCLNLDPENYEAERNSQLVGRRFLKESPLVKTTLFGGVALAIICLVQLWWLWQHFLAKDGTVTEKMLLIMVPLLLGLFVVSFLLPVLVRLKLPGGFEAELSQPKPSESISSGPKGDLGFPSSLPSVSSGSL